MNPSTAMATAIVDELIRCGVRDIVLAPGSRSAPLAYAAWAANQQQRVRLHVRVDERSAAFVALGLGLAAQSPAAVITTSGTAVANLAPAVWEADHASVGLLVISADRPAELVGTGANQTTRQAGVFADFTRWQHTFPVADEGPSTTGARAEATRRGWRTVVNRAVAAAVGTLGTQPGPVHLNVPFRDPLAPDIPSGSDMPLGSDTQVESLEPQVDVVPTGQDFIPGSGPGLADESPAWQLLDPQQRTVAVVGHLPTAAHFEAALRLARLAHWPVIAEPFGDGNRAGVLPHGPLLLESSWWQQDPPDRLVVLGRPTLSRSVAAALHDSRVRVESVTAQPQWADPAHVSRRVYPWAVVPTAIEVVTASPGAVQPAAVAQWSRMCQQAASRLADSVAPLLDRSWPSGPAIAGTVLRALSSTDALVAGSSNAARDLDLAGAGSGSGPTVLANRGLAGIDGTVATAIGVALAQETGRTVALMGDLTFLHDSNALAIGPDEPQPDLLILVVNDDGGGIFTTLEHGEPGRQESFERIFGTPLGTDLAQLCGAHGVPHRRISQRAELEEVVADPGPGLQVAEISVDRGGHRDLRDQLTQIARDVT